MAYSLDAPVASVTHDLHLTSLTPPTIHLTRQSDPQLFRFAHFSDMFQVGTPFASASSCPAFVTTDFALIVGTGNGIEHSIVNNAGDGWFTSTWTGTVTLTAFIGDPTVDGVPDPNVPPLTGQLTEWFGGSFNKNNAVFHSTFHVNVASADGQTTLRVLDVSHANSTPTNPFVPHSFEITTCG